MKNVKDVKKGYGQKNITSSSVVEAVLVLLMPLLLEVGDLDCFESGLRILNFSGNLGYVLVLPALFPDCLPSIIWRKKIYINKKHTLVFNLLLATRNNILKD